MKHALPRGFTLIELMVALAIGALLLLFGMPSFTTYIRNSEIRSTAEAMINGLRTARTEAANRNTPVHFELTTSGKADWTIWYFEEDNVTKDTIQPYSSLEAGRNTLVATNPANNLSVTFDGLGRIVNQGIANDHLQTVDITSAASGEARPLRIIVDDVNPSDPTKPRGLRMCDPDPALPKLTPPDPRAC